ncbi:MAG: hypothetical protein HQ510_07085 [Candidatus Marinimicrobia bacterium]|nr:hypothetical protein [Candidatus Neomarinimicrobiota bacterium]
MVSRYKFLQVVVAILTKLIHAGKTTVLVLQAAITEINSLPAKLPLRDALNALADVLVEQAQAGNIDVTGIVPVIDAARRTFMAGSPTLSRRKTNKRRNPGRSFGVGGLELISLEGLYEIDVIDDMGDLGFCLRYFTCHSVISNAR